MVERLACLPRGVKGQASDGYPRNLCIRSGDKQTKSHVESRFHISRYV